MKMMHECSAIEGCPSYESCNAPLCPLDPQLKDRLWYVDEDICSGRAGSGKRWIKKQRSIVKRQTKSWLDKAISYQDLYDASRPVQMSEERKAELVARMANLRKEAQLQRKLKKAAQRSPYGSEIRC